MMYHRYSLHFTMHYGTLWVHYIGVTYVTLYIQTWVWAVVIMRYRTLKKTCQILFCVNYLFGSNCFKYWISISHIGASLMWNIMLITTLSKSEKMKLRISLVFKCRVVWDEGSLLVATFKTLKSTWLQCLWHFDWNTTQRDLDTFAVKWSRP